MENNQQRQSANTKANPANRSFYQVAYILMIIGTVISAFAIIPMAWMIPMTLATKKAMLEAGTAQEVPHLALGICTLFFAGVIAGIFILVASSTAENH